MRNANELRGHYALLGSLFVYPDATWVARLQSTVDILAISHPDAADALRRLAVDAAAMTREDLEELYTRAFDLNPVAALEVGWHLYGEAYERGRFMAETRALLEKYGIEENGELPDHLSHLLPLLSNVEPERADAVGGARIRPAVQKMAEAFTGNANPLAALLDSLMKVLDRDFGHVESAAPPVVLGANAAPAARSL